MFSLPGACCPRGTLWRFFLCKPPLALGGVGRVGWGTVLTHCPFPFILGLRAQRTVHGITISLAISRSRWTMRAAYYIVARRHVRHVPRRTARRTRTRVYGACPHLAPASGNCPRSPRRKRRGVARAGGLLPRRAPQACPHTLLARTLHSARWLSRVEYTRLYMHACMHALTPSTRPLGPPRVACLRV